MKEGWAAGPIFKFHFFRNGLSLCGMASASGVELLPHPGGLPCWKCFDARNAENLKRIREETKSDDPKKHSRSESPARKTRRRKS